MFLKSAFRAVVRHWRVAAACSGTVFLLGLLAGPRPFSYSAHARIVPVADRWSPSRVQDFALSGAVLDHAARSIGYEDGSELRPGLSARIQSDAVVLTLTAATRARAVERANAVGKSVELLSSSVRRAENDAALHRVEDTLADRRRELDRVAPRESASDRAAREQIAGLEKEIDSGRGEIASTTSRIDHLAALIERNEAGPPAPLKTVESDRLSAQLEIARRQLEELRATYPEDWPPVVRAVALVEDLRLRRAVTSNKEILEARFAPLRAAIEELRRLTARRDRLKQQLPSLEEDLRRLETRPFAAGPSDDGSPVAHARQEAIAAAIRDLEGMRTRIALERASGNEIVHRFEPAASASFTASALGILTLIALAAAFIPPWMIEHLGATIRTEQDIRRYVNLPLLSVIPEVKDASQRILPSAGSAVTEAFNTLAALMEARTVEDGSRLFAVTSSVPSEGKSTVACNAAVALARAGSRVLLVDADLRRGTQHKLFSVSNEPGLSAYLQGGTDTVDSMVSATDIDNLTLMPSGAPMQNPISFLHAERFHALLRDLRGWYEYIILDLPPVRSAADALIVSPLADAVILVAAASQTRKDDLTTTKRMLRSVKSKLCGCVLTKSSVRSGGYYYYPSAVPADAAE